MGTMDLVWVLKSMYMYWYVCLQNYCSGKETKAIYIYLYQNVNQLGLSNKHYKLLFMFRITRCLHPANQTLVSYR